MCSNQWLLLSLACPHLPPRWATQVARNGCQYKYVLIQFGLWVCKRGLEDILLHIFDFELGTLHLIQPLH